MNRRSKTRIKRAKRGERLCPTLTQNTHQWVTEKSEQCVLEWSPTGHSSPTCSSKDLHGHKECSVFHRARAWRRHLKELWLRCKNLIWVWTLFTCEVIMCLIYTLKIYQMNHTFQVGMCHQCWDCTPATTTAEQVLALGLKLFWLKNHWRENAHLPFQITFFFFFLSFTSLLLFFFNYF